MILTGNEIRNQLDTNIVIEPFDEKHLNPNSYNLTLHDEIMIYEEVVLDMRKANRVRRMAIPKEGMVLQPYQLYLARTVERTETHNYVPMIEGRSSIGRPWSVCAADGRFRRRRLLRLLDAGDVFRPAREDLSRRADLSDLLPRNSRRDHGIRQR